MKKIISNGMSSQGYKRLIKDIKALVEESRHRLARTINTALVATYWEIGRRIVVHEQKGKKRAEYGDKLAMRLAKDLSKSVGRGFGYSNLKQMRKFYLTFPIGRKGQTVSGQLSLKKSGGKGQTLSSQLQTPSLQQISRALPLSWSHYVQLMGVSRDTAREFYASEAIKGGWSVRQLDRQIQSQAYERIALSRNKASMILKGRKSMVGDKMTPEEEIKDPYVLEFLQLKDEYSESQLEEALIHHLESFLLELGGDFTFVARQKRLRVGDVWYRVDLVFYHRKLRCLVLIDLKIGNFTHADAGQMHLYLNYAREHWTHSDENPPVGLILCARKNDAVAKYALEGLRNKVMASEYKTQLPKASQIEKEMKRTTLALERKIKKK